MYGVAVYCANTVKLHWSKLQSSKGERSNIYVGLAATTPHNGCSTHFGLSQKANLVLFTQKLTNVQLHWENEVCLPFCRMVNDHSQRVPHSLNPISPQCLPQKANGGYRREVGMARLTSSLCYACIAWFLSINIHAYIAIRITLHLYSNIVLLRYIRINVFLYYSITSNMYSLP